MMTLNPTAPLAPVHHHAEALERHLQQCRDARGRWFGAARRVEQLHGVVAPRFVTTVSFATVLILLVMAWA